MMKLKQLTEKLSVIRPNNVMVCEWTGLSMQAAVFNKAGQKLQVLATANSDSIDPPVAFSQILSSLRTQGWQGKNVIVLTPSVLSAMVELPVSPKKPKPINQMHELVRWEVEPLLMQHQLQWTLGQLMESHGMLTPEQVLEINQAQKSQKQEGSKGERGNKRFGEMALELGYVSREQAQSLFIVQDWLRGEDDDVQCGWSAQGEVDDAPGVWNWLTTATHQSVINKWQELCEDFKLQLAGLMPLTGNSVALIDHAEKHLVVLETTEFITTSSHLKRDRIVSVQHYVNRSASMLDACLEVFHAENTQHPGVVLAAPPDSIPNLRRSLSSALASEPDLVMFDERDGLPPGMFAAGRLFFGLKGAKKISLVRPGGPLPPTWHRTETQAAALVAAMLVLIVISEVTLSLQYAGISKEKAEIDERADVLDAAVDRIKKQREAIEKQKAELIEQKESQRRMEARLEFFGQELPERALLVQAILGVLQNNINEQIVVSRVDEMGRRATVQPAVTPLNKPGMVETDNFNIDAWALTESAAQEFVQNMKLSVTAWDMEVRDIQVIEKAGPMNLAGYSVSMSLVRVISQSELEDKRA
jgi:competence protein ComGC